MTTCIPRVAMRVPASRSSIAVPTAEAADTAEPAGMGTGNCLVRRGGKAAVTSGDSADSPLAPAPLGQAAASGLTGLGAVSASEEAGRSVGRALGLMSLIPRRLAR
ncbi:hypothetical protein ADENT20671_2546 [Actinomyces denticolens]|nr:hypothetical protein ADENT20671_2546 [Actinomyces denticolens]